MLIQEIMTLVPPAPDHSVAKKKPETEAGLKREIIPRELLNLMPNAIIVLADDGTIVEANRFAIEMLKSVENELVGRSLYDLCPPHERTRMERLVVECIDSCTSLTTEATLRLPHGSSIETHLSLSCYPSKRKTRNRYCVLTGRDVSEEKKKELDLLRFTNIAHYTVNPVEITDAHGRITYVNPAFEKASGYSKEELIGRNPNLFGSGKHPKIFWKKMWETIAAGKVWVGEVENRRRNGDPFFTQLLISPIIDGTGDVVGYFGVHRDITDQRHLEQQLIHAQKMESIGMLAAGIAHEVGNPLTSISSVVQVIQRSVEDEFVQEKLELIKSQVTRISRIIRDLVDFSRRSSYEVQLTDVNKGIREAVEIVRIGKKAKEITFEVALDETIPRLRLVPDQIEQVFINILINAVDAIHAESVSSPRGQFEKKKGIIIVRSMLNDDMVSITVEDNGRGISEENLPKIFEPFFTTKKVGEGTGLGLWVSYGIIRSFQGDVRVERAPKRGTKFVITLPLKSEFSTL